MTDLAVQATLLEVPVNLDRLYDGDDPNYELWITEVVDRVGAVHRAKRKEVEKKN